MLLGTVNGWAQKAVVWEKPLSAFNRITQRLTVGKVEFCDTATVMTFHLNFPGGQQIGFSSETMLQADGKDYKVKGIKDYALNAGITIPQSGEMDLDMIFNPLPKDVKSVTFNMPGAFTINDIRDRNAKKDGINDTYWRNDRTGDWMLGVGKDHLVYDSRIWSITLQTEKKGAYTIHAKDGNDAIIINISKEKAGKRTITVGKGSVVGKNLKNTHVEILFKEKAICSYITSSYLPDYPATVQGASSSTVHGASPSGLKDNGYRSGDSITIIGWYKDMPQEMRDLSHEFEAGYQGIFTDSEKMYSAKIDSLGFFTLRMPVENTQMLFCDWRRSNVVLIAEPGETYLLLKDFAEDKTLVMGRNARLQNEWLANETYYEHGNYQKLRELGGAMPYLAHCDSLKNVALSKLDALCKEHPTLSARTVNLIRNDIITSAGRSLMQGRFMAPNYTLPQEYVDYVTENYWNKIEEPYTALGNTYNTFIRDYSDHLLSHLPKPDELPSIYALKRANKEGKIKLSDEEMAIINKHTAAYMTFKKDMEETPDSLKQKVVDDFNNSEVVTKINAIFSREGVQEAVIPILDLYDLERLIAATDSLGWNKMQQDIVLATKFYGMIDHERSPLKPYMLAFVDANIQCEAAKQAIHDLNDKYEAIGKRTLSTDNLKSNDDVKDLSEGEQILRKIIEPYRGKLVLLDVWGTWCGPCKEALAHSQEEYERLKDYPIVYLYLANRSPEENWKNVIKEYNISGDNVVHYNLPDAQQKAVENFLQINSFPTYKLFDQQGNLLDINANPRDLNAFEGLIKRLLK